MLVGGRGERLGGVAKGLINVEGEPIALRLARALRPHAARLTLLDAPQPTQEAERRRTAHLNALKSLQAEPQERPLELCWAQDRADGSRAGPLRALTSALSAARAPWVWVVACDLPLLTSTCLAQLTEGREQHLARLFESSGRLQPLVGLWRRDALSHLVDIERRGAPLQSIKGAPWVQVCTPQEQAALFNLNTLHDLEQLTDLL